MSKTALIAGGGSLPGLWLERAREAGRRVFVYKIARENTLPLNKAEKIRSVSPGKLGELIARLENDGIEEIIMLGKVHKDRLYDNMELDKQMKTLLAELPDHQDETILKGIAAALERAGFNILPQDLYLEDSTLESGTLYMPSHPPRNLQNDFQDGLGLAKKMAELEIGQTVLLKNGTVLAVEAVEGTDKAISRAGELAGPGVVMAKASRPEQDDRLDIPAVGPQTAARLAAIEAAGLVIEAGGVLVLEQEKMLEKVRAAEIALQAI